MRFINLSHYASLVFLLLSCILCGTPAQAQRVRPITIDSTVPAHIDAMYVRGLRYLIGKQTPQGDFGAGYGNNPGVVGLCMMSALAHGDDPNVGAYSPMIKKCLAFIFKSQNATTGYMGDTMYAHGFATLALAEAYGMVHDERIALALEKAVKLILSAQKSNPLGGWRYSPNSNDGDTTISGCQIVALLAARNAGIPVPDEALTRALLFMKSCRDKEGRYGYTSSGGGSVTLSAIGLLSLSLTKKQDDDSFAKTLAYLKQNLNHRNSSYPYYFEYYMSQALFQAEEATWRTWNDNNIKLLLATQAPNGSWAGDESTAYSTAAALLSVALNYRFLPIYEK